MTRFGLPQNVVFAQHFGEHCEDAETGFSYPAGKQKHMTWAGPVFWRWFGIW